MGGRRVGFGIEDAGSWVSGGCGTRRPSAFEVLEESTVRSSGVVGVGVETRLAFGNENGLFHFLSREEPDGEVTHL